jgi:hypothetical protein
MPATSDTRLPKPADAKVEKPSFTPSVASISSPATSCSQKRQLQNSVVEALLISSAEHRKYCSHACLADPGTDCQLLEAAVLSGRY